MSTVVLVRHGETDWNRDERVQGWAPAPLNDRGRQQARTLGEHVVTSYDVDRIVASDLRRTTETVREIRRVLSDADVEFSREWRERDFGVLQGLSYEALFEGYPEFSVFSSGAHAVPARPEGGESWLDLGERVLAAWERLLSNAGDETVLVVTHGGPIHVVIGELRGLDAVSSITDVELGNCALTEVDVTDEPRIEKECVVDFLGR